MSEQRSAETRAEAVVDALGLLYHDDLDPDDFMLFPGDGAPVIQTDADVSDWQTTYGGRDAFECLVRTILSQHTSDVASQPAHEALLRRYLDGPDGAGTGGDDPDGAGTGEEDTGGAGTGEEDTGGAGTGGDDLDGAGTGEEDTGGAGRDEDDSGGASTGGDGLCESLAVAEHAELAATIRSAGLYNQKAEKIIGAANWVRDEFGSGAAFDAFVTEEDPQVVRSTLLEVDGVGPKTADCVLLFAGGTDGVFPVDTHVHRIARRIGLAPEDADHEVVREALERAVPADKCGFGHTAMIQFGREYCTARQPVCLDDPEACPLASLCDRVGLESDD